MIKISIDKQDRICPFCFLSIESAKARKVAAIRAYHEWLPTPDFELHNATAVAQMKYD